MRQVTQELATWVETNSGWPVSRQPANGQVSGMNSGQAKQDLTRWARPGCEAGAPERGPGPVSPGRIL